MPPPTPLDPRHVFGTLDPALPLALLPVRVETRFYLDADPPELRVRIIPDAIHADAHHPALTPSELALGGAFWDRTWRSGPDVAGKDAAFGWLAGRLGPWRAAWVASRLAPTNPRKAPTAPVPDGVPLTPPPALPAVETRVAGGEPTWARLLPERFSVTLYTDEWVPEGTWWGAPIELPLPLAPGPVDLPEDRADDLDGRSWLDAQGLAWTHDFVAAEAAGLGVRIDLSDVADVDWTTFRFPYLVVCGVRGGDQRVALESLLTAHRYTGGLDLVPQGTPTNTTEQSAPGLSLEAPDLATLRRAELEPGPVAVRPALTEDGDLYRRRGADAACLALGLGRDTALDRAGNAGLAELANAEAMNRATWPALAGHYLDHVLGGILSESARAWLRDWGTLFARGGGPLPTLLAGAQPYGLLPVSLLPREEQTDPAGEVETLEEVLGSLLWHWLAGSYSVPRLDPDATDVGGDETLSESELAAVVSQVLGAVPHPTQLRLQLVEATRSEYVSAWSARLLIVGLAIGGAPPSDGEPYDEPDDAPAWDNYVDCMDALAIATTAFEQRVALEALADTLDAYSQRDDWGQAVVNHYTLWRDYVNESLVEFVRQHELRTAPVLPLLDRYLPSLTGLMGELDEPAAFFNTHPPDAATTWTLPLVAAGRTAVDVSELRGWLDRMAGSLDAHWGRANDYTTTYPLVRQLFRRSIELATDAADQAVVRAGLTAVAEIARTAPDPVGELERLLRETLGVYSYRLDAWFTADAAWRLENKRQARARGIQAGAFGMLVDVRPSVAPGPSQGYLFAPSLTHASTAAVLRSGWAALGGNGQSAGLAVDLSSDRVRRARWLVDGVRAGQDLGQLIGARFERALHDAVPGLDRWIDDVRRVALAATGSGAPAAAIVDGLLLARAWSADDDLTAVEQAAAGLLADLLATTGTDRAGLEAVLDSLLADLDAVADTAAAEAVFALVQGNQAQATTTLTASSTGATAFPELRVTDTSRPALTVTHRLLLLLDPDARSSWPATAASGRAQAAPALDAWVAFLLGEPWRYAFTVTWSDSASGAALGPAVAGTLADLGLAALDVVRLAPTGEATGLGDLGPVISAWARGRLGADVIAGLLADLPADVAITIASGLGDPSLDDLVTVCRELRPLLAQARDLDGRDLAAPGATEVPAGLDVADLAARVGAVRAALVDGRARLDDALPAGPGGSARSDVRAAMFAFNGFTLPAAIPRALDPAGLVAEGEALRTVVDARLADDDALAAEDAAQAEGQPDGSGGLDDVGLHTAAARRVALLVGHPTPLVPRVTPGNATELAATFARPRLRSPSDAVGWLAAAGRVDPAAGRLRIAVDLVEAARPEAGAGAGFGFALGQLPDVEGEGWAALERPSGDERGRLCLFATGPASSGSPAQVGLAAPLDTGPWVGLVLGAWTEAAPHLEQTAGLAVHFDAPSARAPQAILLATTPPERGWDFDVVRDVVYQTLQLAIARTVGPQTLPDLGQYLPAAYLHPDTAAAAGGAAS